MQISRHHPHRCRLYMPRTVSSLRACASLAIGSRISSGKERSDRSAVELQPVAAPNTGFFSFCLYSGHAVATKLRCPSLSKVKMSVGGFAGSVSWRREDHPIGAVPASAGSLRLQFGGRACGQSVAIQPCQNIKTVQLALAHHHHAHRNDSLRTPKKEQKLTSLLCSVLTF